MKATTTDRLSALQTLWTKRADIQAYNVRQRQLNLETMPIGVQVWFNVAAAQIVNAWNDGSPTLTGADLKRRTLATSQATIASAEWTKAVTTFCLPNITGAMNFLLFTPSPDTYVINYPAVAQFMNSGLGNEWMPALEMLFGLRVERLREPEPGLESEWCSWLSTIDGSSDRGVLGAAVVSSFQPRDTDSAARVQVTQRRWWQFWR